MENVIKVLNEHIETICMNCRIAELNGLSSDVIYEEYMKVNDFRKAISILEKAESLIETQK